MESAFKKLPPSVSAYSELEDVVKQLDYSQDISRQIENEFGDGGLGWTAKAMDQEVGQLSHESLVRAL